MFTKAQLAQLQQLRKDIAADNKKALQVAESSLKSNVRKEIETSAENIKKDIGKDIEASEKRMKDELNKDLGKKIIDSQQDTIEVLTEVIHRDYNAHDKRIQRVEDELDLNPLKQ